MFRPETDFRYQAGGVCLWNPSESKSRVIPVSGNDSAVKFLEEIISITRMFRTETESHGSFRNPQHFCGCSVIQDAKRRPEIGRIFRITVINRTLEAVAL